MIQSAVTVSLVPEARGGPFVFWDDLAAACSTAGRLGFDAIEIFSPTPKLFERESFRSLLSEHRLKLAAVGTGAGWVLHKWHLTHADPAIRQKARGFILDYIRAAAPHGASAIIGSMHGRVEGSVTRAQALEWLGEGLRELGAEAARLGIPLFIEPLNRYESNLLNSVVDTAARLDEWQVGNVRILADLFHMNIEEVDIAAALRQAGQRVGHIHFIDSNRRAAGFGHIDYAPICDVLREINYGGYLSAEAVPLPDSETAARQHMLTFKKLFPR